MTAPTAPADAPTGPQRIAVCDYGAGNVRSVVAALGRLGPRVDVTVTADPAEVRGADVAILPGVGSAGSAMARLTATGLDRALRDRAAAERPVVGICLGLQLALEGTDEDGGVEGLGIVPGRAVRLAGERVPRLGWAPVDPVGETFYFAHSYVAETPAASAWSEGRTAVATAGSYLGCQFHPEKSGPAGARWLRRCLSLD